MQELYPDGSIKRILPVLLTAEQRGDCDAQDALHQNEEDARIGLGNFDRALLETYRNVKEIDQRRDLELEPYQVVGFTNKQIALYQEERKLLENDAEFYAGKKIPAKLKRDFEINTAQRHQEEKIKDDAEKQIEKINMRCNAWRTRFLEIVGPNHDAQVTTNH